MIINQGLSSDQLYFELEELPLVKHMEATCFITSMSPEVVRRIAAKSCENNEKNYVVHPLLLMMKLSYRAVDIVTTTIHNQDDSYLIVMTELSPYH